MRERDSKRPFITDKAGQTSPATGVTDLMKKRTDDGSLDIEIDWDNA